MIRKNKGMTLIELTAVLAILAIIAAYSIPKMEEIWTERIVDNAAESVQNVFSASRRYRLVTGSWPTTIGNLTSGNTYLTFAAGQPPLGGSYTFTNVGPNLRIQFDAQDSKYARRLMARLPFGSVFGVTNVRSEITVPGQEASFAALDSKYYHRDGSQPLTGDLSGGNQNAINLNTIEANRIVDRNDITKILDPSSMSTINDLTARNITAVNVNATNVDTTNLDATNGDITNLTANYARTTNLRVDRVATNGSFCNPASTGNIALTSAGDIATCKSGAWAVNSKLSYQYMWPSTLYSGSMLSGQQRTLFLPSGLPSDYEALEITVICATSAGDNATVEVSDSSSGPWLAAILQYAAGNDVTTTNSMTIKKRDTTSNRLYARTTSGNCNGFYVTLTGYWS